jgi:hypothetical protein
VVTVEVRDGAGQLVAAFRGTAYRKEQAVAAPRAAVRRPARGGAAAGRPPRRVNPS